MRYFVPAVVAASLLTLPAAAGAVVFGGVEFPQGAASFADAVVSYSPTNPLPIEPLRDPTNALGVPDYAGAPCLTQADCTFVTLGDGGSLVVRFTDNVLTGSGTSALDLWIFEIGPDVEDMFVDVSVDGNTWLSVGSVGGATAGIDLDSFGFGISSAFSYVRLTDDTDKDDQTGASVGADVDAIGAISTRLISGVPEASTWAMMLIGFAGIGMARRTRRRLIPTAVSA